MRTWLIALLLAAVCATSVSGQPAIASDRKTAAEQVPVPDGYDSLAVIPRPLCALEGGRLRWGLGLAALRIFRTQAGILPFVELGADYFDRVDASPDDKKMFFLRGGAFIPAGAFSLRGDIGIATIGGQAAPSLGCGLWHFSGLAVRTPPALADYPDYTAWLDAQRKFEAENERSQSTALGASLHLLPGLDPALVLSFSFVMFF